MQEAFADRRGDDGREPSSVVRHQTSVTELKTICSSNDVLQVFSGERSVLR